MPYKTPHHAKPENTSYVFKGIKQIFITPITSLILITTITFAITIATIFYILQQNTIELSDKWNESSEISLYLKNGINLKTASDLVEKLRPNSLVAKITLIQPSEGMKHFVENTSLNTLISNFKDNPLPNVIIIHPKVELLEKSTAIEFIKTLKTYPEIEIIKADTNWIERIHSLLNLWNNLSTLFIFVLSLNALLVICGSSYIMTQVFIARSSTPKTILPYQFAWYGFISGLFSLLSIRIMVIYVQSHGILLQELDIHHGALIVIISSLLGTICSNTAAKTYNKQH